MPVELAFCALLIEALVGYPERVARAIGHPVVLIGALIGISVAVAGTWIALKITGLVTTIRMTGAEEDSGMDLALHGEGGYVMEE